MTLNADLAIQNLSRRTFVLRSLGGMLGLMLGLDRTHAANVINVAPTSPQQIDYVQKFRSIPLLFCTAYITPDAPGQEGQERIVARYPLVLVPQDARSAFVQWRDHVKVLNPSIVMLGYQIVIEESTVPGPGHDILVTRGRAANAFCVYPGGFMPTVNVNGWRRRIYDPRNAQWQAAFLDACRATLASYPYDGLFLDQCTVYDKAHPLPSVRLEMRQALQETILQLRKEVPATILVGNSSYDWAGLNGELCEGRANDMKKESALAFGHNVPRMEFYQSVLGRSDDIETVTREMALAHSYGAFYGAAVDYQHVLWFDLFDDVVARRR